MNIEESREKAEKLKAPLIICAIILSSLGVLKIFYSIPLFVIECVCGALLFSAAVNLSFRLAVLFEIFVVLTMVQFLWIFGDIIQIKIETGTSPLFIELYQSLFLWTVIATFFVDIFFVITGYHAYKAFKYLEFVEKSQYSPFHEKQTK